MFQTEIGVSIEESRNYLDLIAAEGLKLLERNAFVKNKEGKRVEIEQLDYTVEDVAKIRKLNLEEFSEVCDCLNRHTEEKLLLVGHIGGAVYRSGKNNKRRFEESKGRKSEEF